MPILAADRIALGATAENRYQAIRLAGELLVRAGCVLPEYVDGMVERELSMCTALGDYPIAIPHGMLGNAGHIRSSGISVVQLKEPVAWGPDAQVSVVVGLAAEGEEHLELMARLGDLVDDEAWIQELVHTSDPSWVLACLGGQGAAPAEPAPAAGTPQPEPGGLQAELTVQNPTGLHLRPATVLAELAGRFQSDIRLRCGDKVVNAKSMAKIVTLRATLGSRILLLVSGEDQAEAFDRIREAILAGLGDALPTPAGAPSAGAAPAAPAPAAPASVSPAGVRGAVPAPAVPGLLQGVAAAPGIAVGPAFQYRTEEPDLDRLEAGPRDGQVSLEEALPEARRQLEILYQRMVDRKMAAEAAIFKAHAMLMEDPDLLAAVRVRIAAGQWAPRAWQSGVEELAGEFAGLDDPTLAGRADDVRDVGRRVLRLMLKLDDQVTLPDHPVVVLARELSPSVTASFDPSRVLGFCIINGGPTSHIAILARAHGLPAVVAAPEALLDVAPQTPVILDGGKGTLAVDPPPEALERAARGQQALKETYRLAMEQAHLPTVTTDGHPVDVTANIGSLANAVKAVENHADGSGLLRTEFLFLDRATAPTEDEQHEVYRGIAQAMGTRPVIVRTLDIGGDKPVPYIQMAKEENPFLGVRGIRLCLDQPGLFRDQLRAILRASVAGCLRIMFPMVSDVAEIRRARALVEELRLELGVPPVQVGIMIEVPSAALLADKLAPEVDFFSIGTNDLTQYTLAVDRGNDLLASRHDGLHPAVLRLIAMTAEASHRHGKRTDICGELGSDPAAIPVLIGLGVDELSVSIKAVPLVKMQVRSLALAGLKLLARQALDCATAQEVRELVKSSTN